ncbi:hypothetical protein [Candidatus Nitrospira bockiana]
MKRLRAELEQARCVAETLADIQRTFATPCVPDLFIPMTRHPGYLETAWDLFKERVALERLTPAAKRILAAMLSADKECQERIMAFRTELEHGGLDEKNFRELLDVVHMIESFNRVLATLHGEVQS